MIVRKSTFSRDSTSEHKSHTWRPFPCYTRSLEGHTSSKGVDFCVSSSWHTQWDKQFQPLKSTGSHFEVHSLRIWVLFWVKSAFWGVHLTPWWLCIYLVSYRPSPSICKDDLWSFMFSRFFVRLFNWMLYHGFLSQRSLPFSPISWRGYSSSFPPPILATTWLLRPQLKFFQVSRSFK